MLLLYQNAMNNVTIPQKVILLRGDLQGFWGILKFQVHFKKKPIHIRICSELLHDKALVLKVA